MRLRPILATTLLLIMLVGATEDDENDGRRKQKKKMKGCELNKKVYRPGRVVYKDKAHCMKLKCVKVKKKGKKAEYVLRPKRYGGCECFPLLCRGPRCSPPVCPVCTQVWEPVCGSNGKNYSNECMFFGSVEPCGQDLASLLYYGKCGECPTGCPKNIDPVCGSDGETYNNECLLITEACETNTTISKEHDGPCTVTNKKCDKCPKIRKPVCGSNGVTYSNECLLDAAICKGVNVTMAYTGECVDDLDRDVVALALRKKCKYNGKKYKAGDIIEDLVDYCLTAICQPSRKAGKTKVEFVDFQGATACECTRDRLRKQVLRMVRN